MKKYGVNELRQMFLDFMESKGHLVMKSFSLVPQGDKSLLLINAGMAPLKPYFTGMVCWADDSDVRFFTQILFHEDYSKPHK